MKFACLKIAVPIVFAALPCAVVAQKLDDTQKALFEQKMFEASQKIHTLQCSFVQEKTSAVLTEKAAAQGVMLYQSPSMLHWEYVAPAPSTLILNGSNAALFNKDGKRIGNESMLKQLGTLIISMINGEGIKNNKMFTTDFYDGGSEQITAVLTPAHKRLKEFYSSIELKIDSNTFLAAQILLHEKSGDKTCIRLVNKKLNEKIDMVNFTIK